MATAASTRQIAKIGRHFLASACPRPVTSTAMFALPRRQLTLSTTVLNRNSRSIDQPSTRINSLNLNLEAPPTIPESGDSIKSIDQVMRDIQREAELKAAYANAQYSHLSDPVAEASKEQQSRAETESQQDQQYQHSTSSENPYADANANAYDSSSSSGVPPPQPPKNPTRFWFYLYHILYWSALGSIPVHLLLTKGETKDFKTRQEWKISVLTDMRDKLQRGESIEEEEALLTVGHDRSKREEQVDEKYFEDCK
jgi:hypothetical protein